eukprot:s102_g29.t8
MLAPIVQTLTDVSTAMCGGAHEFVWTLDKRRVVLMSPTTGGGWDNLSGSIQMLGVYWSWSVEGLEEPILNYLRNAVGNQSLRGCADAKPYCDSITKMPGWTNDGGTGFTVRMKLVAALNQGAKVYISRAVHTARAARAGKQQLSRISAAMSLAIAARIESLAERISPTSLVLDMPTCMQDAVVTAVCKEKSAEELRNFTPWISWVNTIEAFSQEEGSLMGKPEAARLAQAMWEHGCGFAANLSAEILGNISWGTCDQWNTTFDWHWKTDCLFANNQYYCPENAPTIKGSLVVDISNPVLMIPHVNSLSIAIQELVAQLAGNGVEPWMVYPKEVGGIPGLGRRLAMVQLEFEIYQIGGNMDESAIKQNLQEGESSQMTSIFVTALDGLGVNTAAWGLSVQSISFGRSAPIMEVALEVAKMVEMVRVETALVEMAMTVLATTEVILATTVAAAAAQAAAVVAQAEVVQAGMEMMVQVTTLAVAVALAVAAAPAEMEMMVLVMILVVAVAPAAVAPVGMEVTVLAATLAVAAAQVGMEVMVLVTTLAVAPVAPAVVLTLVLVVVLVAAVAPAVVLTLVLVVVLVAAVAVAPVAAALVLVGPFACNKPPWNCLQVAASVATSDSEFPDIIAVSLHGTILSIAEPERSIAFRWPDMALLLGSLLGPGQHVDFFSHPQGLVVIDHRLCLPPDDGIIYHVRAELVASASQRLRLQLFRPDPKPQVSQDEAAGYWLLHEVEHEIDEGSHSIDLPFPFRPGDCMGWQSRDHGVIGFDEDEGGASVLLLLPGAPLQSGERLARESFAGPVPRRYAISLAAHAVASHEGDSTATDCMMQEDHWGLSSSSGMQRLPQGDGFWSLGNRRLCEHLDHEFVSGRFHFHGDQAPLQFGLCHPKCIQADVVDVAERLLEALAPKATAASSLRRVDLRREAQGVWPMHGVGGLALLIPGLVGMVSDIALQRDFSPAGRGPAWPWPALTALTACSPFQALRRSSCRSRAATVRLCCLILGFAHLLLSLDAFCAPGPPAGLWRDADTILGYVSTHVLFLLSAQNMLTKPAQGPADAVGRLCRKWLRLAPVGLALRLASCGLAPLRSRTTGPWTRRRALPTDSLDIDCVSARCTAGKAGPDVVGNESTPGKRNEQKALLPARLPITAMYRLRRWKECVKLFSLKDTLMAFPEVADVGWFLEADLTHGLVLTALSVLESFGQRGSRAAALLTAVWGGELLRCVVSGLSEPRQVFECRRAAEGLQLEALLTKALPHFCLNFALGPFLAWVFRKASCMPECLMFAWLLPWTLDCSVLRLLGLPGACYTGAGPESIPEAGKRLVLHYDTVAAQMRMWNTVRWLSLVGLHLSLLRWLQRDSTQTKGLLFLLDRLAFGMLVSSPWILRLVLFSWRDSCCQPGLVTGPQVNHDFCKVFGHQSSAGAGQPRCTRRQKKLLKELQARLGQLGFAKLRVSQEFSGEDAGKVRVSVSWAGLESSEPSPKCCKCFAFLWALPMLLTKGPPLHLIPQDCPDSEAVRQPAEAPAEVAQWGEELPTLEPSRLHRFIMTFAMSLAINAVQEQASREAQDAAMSERWVRSQVASIKSTCVAASKRCEYSAEIVTDGLPSLHQQEGQKKLLKELQTRLGQLGFTKLRVSQESSGEDAGKVRVSVSWAGLESKSQCFEFVRALPTLLTKGLRIAKERAVQKKGGRLLDFVVLAGGNAGGVR